MVGPLASRHFSRLDQEELRVKREENHMQKNVNKRPAGAKIKATERELAAMKGEKEKEAGYTPIVVGWHRAIAHVSLAVRR